MHDKIVVRRWLAPYLALDRRLWLLTLARCINVMGFSIVMPFMALYLVEDRQLSAKTYGAIYFIAGIIAAFSQAHAGEVADMIGRRRVIVRALIWRAMLMLALAAAVQWHAPIEVLGLLILTNGYLRARVEPAVSAAVSDLAAAGDRVAAFGLQRVGINVGWAMGPAIGGAFVHGTYGMMFCVASPLLLLAAFAASRVDDSKRHAPAMKTSEAAAFDMEALRTVTPAFGWYLVLSFFAGLLTTQMFATMSVYARLVVGLTEGEVGLLYTVNGLLVVGLQVFGVVLIKKFGPRVTLFYGPMLFALGFFGYGVATTFWQMAAVTGLLTLGEVLFAPAQNDMAAELGDKKRMGRAFGLYGFSSSLGVSLGPLAGGAVFDAYRTSPLILWGIIGSAMSVLACGYAVFSRRLAPS